MPEKNKARKLRIDQLLVEKGLAQSRERAQAFVIAGKVFVDTHKVHKSSDKFSSDQDILVKGPDHPYVGRGGLKLKTALDEFKIIVQDFICIDMGASTGGFTDCLLQNQAQKVYAIDVGRNQIDYKLRSDPRVIVHEKMHALKVEPILFHEEKIDLMTMDVSFISIKKILPHLVSHIPHLKSMILLIKPQFEVGRSEIEKGGLVKDLQKHQRVCQEISELVASLDFQVIGVTPSQITGDKGNQEYLLYAKHP